MVLLNYLLPRDVLKAIARERVTGLTAVPPLWIQLAQLSWPEDIGAHLRYIANTGGRMPLETLTTLRSMLPKTKLSRHTLKHLRVYAGAEHPHAAQTPRQVDVPKLS